MKGVAVSCWGLEGFSNTLRANRGIFVRLRIRVALGFASYSHPVGKKSFKNRLDDNPVKSFSQCSLRAWRLKNHAV